jgi:NAD(P)H-dependent FMN reductase
MITVIAGTNRTGSRTKIVASFIYEFLKETSREEVNFLSLEDLPGDAFGNGIYSAEGQSKALGQIQNEILIPAGKWCIVIPEYNGGIPGIFKYFIDAISMRELKSTFSHKKICLTGVAAGRAGNLRGLDYMTVSFNYLKSFVYHNRLPISQINKQIEEEELIESTKELIKNQIKGFLEF